MPVNEFDKASRFTAKIDPPGFLRWALGLPLDSFTFGEWLDTRGLPFPGDADRTGDTIARMENLLAGGEPWAVVLEFQTEPDPLMFGRLLEYLGQLWRRLKPDPERGSRFHVGAVVLNLTGRGQASRDMRWAGMATQLQVVERNLATESADELLGASERGEQSRALLPWLPLMTGADDAATIERWKRAAEAEPDVRTRSDYGGLAKVFADVANRKPLWDLQLKEWNVKRSSVVEEWRAEGRIEERMAALLEVLELRFGDLPPDLVKGIYSTNSLPLLQLWFPAANTESSLAAFRSRVSM